MSALHRAELFLVRLVIRCENLLLRAARRILFSPLRASPERILIYKVGNIGDITCAIPSFIAIRRAFPGAKIALLTSPGERGAVGAKELLSGAWFIDELKVYYADEIGSFKKIKRLVRETRKYHADLFIQLPDDIANFRTLARNLCFAKALGVRSAFGFKIRTVRLFKNTQVDYTRNEPEVQSLLDILKENGVPVRAVEFDFPGDPLRRAKIEAMLKEKWKNAKNEIVVSISPGGKRATNHWPLERFREVAEYLSKTHRARIVIVGGKDDVAMAKEITKHIPESHVLITCGKFSLLETVELLRHSTFLISNSTGTIHLAAAAGVPCVGIYGVRDIFKRWFPYGENNIILHHTPFPCDYRSEECIQKSIESISVSEVIGACDKLINKQKKATIQ